MSTQYRLLKINSKKIYNADFNLELDAIEMFEDIVKEPDNQYLRIIRNLLPDKYNNDAVNYMSEIIMVDCSYTKIDCNGHYCQWKLEERDKEIELIDEKIKNTEDEKIYEYLKREKENVKNRYNKQMINMVTSVKRTVKVEKSLGKLIDDGFTLNDVHYNLIGMSSSQAKNGIKVFISDDIFDKVFEYSTLGKVPEKCKIPKYEAYRNLLFSSAHLIEYIPNIVIIKDYKINIDDVEIKYPVDKEIEYTKKSTNEQKKYKTKDMESGKTTIEINCFDGAGMHSKAFNRYLRMKLKLNYTPVSYQIRMAFMKGLSTCVDFKSVFKELGITKIKDIDNVWHDVKDIDCLWAESMWKGVSFFDSFAEYKSLLKKYNHVFAVTQWNKPTSMESNFTRVNYQYLQAMHNLTGNDLIKMSQHSKDWIEKILTNPSQAVKFLKLDSEEDIINDYTNAIFKNNEMIYDESVRDSIISMLKKYVNQFKFGKIFITGKYHYVTPDFWLMLTYIANSSEYDVPIQSCLTGNTMFSKGLKGTYASFRSPMLAENEINKVEMVENEITEKWFNHFDNIVMVNSASILAQKQQTMDYDGDRIFLTNEKTILQKVRTGLPLIIDINEEKPLTLDYNPKNLKEYHMRTLDCLVGEQSNKATVLQNKQKPSKYDKELELLSIIVQKETDFVKAGIRWNCPYEIKKLTEKLPYFLIYRYPDLLAQYKEINSKRKRVSNSMRKKAELMAYNELNQDSKDFDVTEFVKQTIKYASEYDDKKLNAYIQQKIDNKLQNEKDLELPVLKTQSPMNKLCWDIEAWEKQIKFNLPKEDMRKLYVHDDIPDNKEMFDKLEKLYLQYVKQSAEQRKLEKKKNKTTEDELAITDFNWEKFKNKYKNKAIELCPDEQQRLKYLTDILYQEKYHRHKKKFVWVCCADTILKNLTRCV
jgi:hypothetical protein